MSEETPVKNQKTETSIEQPPADKQAGLSVDTINVPADKAPVPEQQPVIRVQKKAIIEWKAGPEQEVTETVTHFRSLAALYALLMDVLKQYPAKAKDYLEIYLQVETTDPKNPQPKLYIAKGTLEEVIVKLGSKCMVAPQAVMEIQMMLGHISEISTLKGAILTLVFDDAQAGGLGFLTESNDVTQDDIKVLAEAAASQSDLFKEKMRAAKGIVFPSDKGKIIMPGEAMPTNLRFRKR